MQVITCEQVSDGHSDKLCDQIADAVVTDCLKHDKSSRVAVEVLVKNEFIVIAGEITSKWSADYNKLVSEVLEKIGADKIDYENIKMVNMIREQNQDVARAVKKGLAGDQAIVYGYATNETPEMLPIPFVLATDFMVRLKSLNDPRLKADAKAQVSFDYDSREVKTFLCSAQHREDISPKDYREDITRLMKDVCAERGFNTDFEKLVTPTGRFVKGGAFADCGVTGRKIACDTYGGVGRSGGALSGKDPTKVDRSGAYIARAMAKSLIVLGYCDRCEVQLAYAIGMEKPVAISIDTFGTSHADQNMIDDYVKGYDLSPRGIIDRLDLLNVDYNEVSSYGHFWKQQMPWEKVV